MAYTQLLRGVKLSRIFCVAGKKKRKHAISQMIAKFWYQKYIESSIKNIKESSKSMFEEKGIYKGTENLLEVFDKTKHVYSLKIEGKQMQKFMQILKQVKR